MMHKTDSGLRPYYLTHEFTIHDAPFDNEIVIAIGGASSGRAHARTGDRSVSYTHLTLPTICSV